LHVAEAAVDVVVEVADLLAEAEEEALLAPVDLLVAEGPSLEVAGLLV
jgi:hypothetical protein